MKELQLRTTHFWLMGCEKCRQNSQAELQELCERQGKSPDNLVMKATLAQPAAFCHIGD